MLGIRSLVLGSLVLSATGAMASFELVMVADNGVNTFASRKIHRFDGDTGTYLGSFGGFGADIIGTHLNKATNSLFVITNDFRVAEYDYNTGRLKRGTNIDAAGTMAIVRPAGDTSARVNGSAFVSLYSFPSFGSVGNPGPMSGATLTSGAWISNTRFAGYDSTGRVGFWNINASGLTGSFDFSYAVVATTVTSQMIYRASDQVLIHPINGQINIYTASINSWGFVGTGGSNNRHAALGHDGFFTMGERGGLWTLDKYDGTYAQRGQWGLNIVMNPASMQAVVAPEPGTMAALGFGALALLRRRRK